MDKWDEGRAYCYEVDVVSARDSPTLKLEDSPIRVFIFRHDSSMKSGARATLRVEKKDGSCSNAEILSRLSKLLYKTSNNRM